jgi:hypothetical protein
LGPNDEKKLENRRTGIMRSFVGFVRYYQDNNVKENEIGVVCNIHGGNDKLITLFNRRT